MKKNYILLLLFATLTMQGQIIDDDFESYTPGPMGTQATWWTTWSGTTGGAEDIEVTTEEAQSGSQSGLIAEGSTQDSMLLLGNEDSGAYIITWEVFVPSGKTGYWNIQEDESPGVQWNAEFFIGATASGGSAGVISHDGSSNTVSYTEDTWMTVETIIDLDGATFSVTVDGEDFLTDEPYPGDQLGAINFFSIDTNNKYYIDDIYYDTYTICYTPDGLDTEDTTDVTAEVSWEASTNETNGYNWFLYQNGADPDVATPVASGSVANGITLVEITDLEPETTYDFYVSALCDDDMESNLAGPETFTTDELICHPPSEVMATEIADTYASFVWTASSAESQGYVWFIMYEGEAPGANAPAEDGNVSSGVTEVEITGLEPETGYDFYVQTQCPGGDESVAEGPFPFTTESLNTEENSLEDFYFYPNPVLESFHLEASHNIDNISIYNIKGQKVFHQKLQTGVESIDISSLASGTYFLKAMDHKNNFEVYKLVKK